MIRRLPLLLALGCFSCGYEVGNLYEIRDVKVDIFDNISERRTHEFDLTDAIVQEIAARGIRVNARDAAYTLKGRILDIRTPSLVDQKNTDQVIVSSVLFHVEVRLMDGQGNELWRESRIEQAAFSTARGESDETARRTVFDKLARWVTTKLEKQW